MVCGASTAFGSLTVTTPVYFPLARVAVVNAICTPTQVPCSVQECAPVMLAASQDTLAVAVRLRFPSPKFAASTLCVAPFWPGTTKIGPTVAVARRRRGAARSAAEQANDNTEILVNRKCITFLK